MMQASIRASLSKVSPAKHALDGRSAGAPADGGADGVNRQGIVDAGGAPDT